MEKKYNIVFITDLEHSAPRVSNFIHYLSKDKELNVSLIGADYSRFLEADDLPINFNDGVDHYLFRRRFRLMTFLRKIYLKSSGVVKSENLDLNSTNSSFKFQIKKTIVSIKTIFVNTFLRLNFPDQYIYSVFKYVKTYRKCFKDKETVVISSSPYPTSHIAAYIIKRRFKNVKWIADYRDMWTFNHNYSFGNVRKLLDFKLEKYIIKRCDQITTVCEPWGLRLSETFNKEVIIIPNGYSKVQNQPVEVELLSSKSNKIYLLYVGTISFNIHNVEMFLSGIRKLVKSNPDKSVEAHFCGNYSDVLDVLIENYQLKGVVKQIGRFTRNEVIQKQKKYDFLFYFDCLIDDGVLLLKFFEYIHANRPILAFGNNEFSESGKILRKLKRGVYFKSSNEFHEFLKNYILSHHEFFLNSEQNEEYSYETQSEKLKSIIKTLHR